MPPTLCQIILMDESLKQLAQLFEIAGEYDANLKKLMATTFIPGFLSLAGVFLLGTGNATAPDFIQPEHDCRPGERNLARAAEPGRSGGPPSPPFRGEKPETPAI